MAGHNSHLNPDTQVETQVEKALGNRSSDTPSTLNFLRPARARVPDPLSGPHWLQSHSVAGSGWPHGRLGQVLGRIVLSLRQVAQRFKLVRVRLGVTRVRPE